MTTNNPPPPSSDLNTLTLEAERQMRELDLSNNKTTNGNNGRKQRSSSLNRVLSPTSSQGSGGEGEMRKKLPMNRITVGHTPSPNISSAKSKIGSLANATHTPGGGKVKIESRKLDWGGVGARVGSKVEVEDKDRKKKIQQGTSENNKEKIQSHRTPNYSAVKSRIGSLANTTHTPGGGDKRIFDDKEYLKQRKSREDGGGARGRSSSVASSSTATANNGE